MGYGFEMNPITGKLDMVGSSTPAVVVNPTLVVTPNIAAKMYHNGSTLNVTFSITPTKGTYNLKALKMKIGTTTTTIAENAESGHKYEKTQTISSDTTVTFTIEDMKGNKAEKSLAYSFGELRYLGFANQPTGGDSTITESWLDTNFAPANKTLGKNYVVAAKKYSNNSLNRFYVAIPKETGVTYQNIKTLLAGSMWMYGMMLSEPTEVTITYANNRNVVYRIFKSEQDLSTTNEVEVKVD